MSSKNINKFYGLIIEDEEEEYSNEYHESNNIKNNNETNNELRKLRKKLKEISILEVKDFSSLNQEQIDKLKKKDIIVNKLNSIYKNNEQKIKPKVKIKKEKNLKQLEIEQLQHQSNLLKKKEERKKTFENFWRDKYKKYESYTANPTNEILEQACKIMNVNINNINQEILKSQYHKLALKNHPDKGGTHHQMVNISSSYGIIKKFLDYNNTV